MEEKELKCFLVLLICSDPWPIEDEESNDVLQKFADEESKRHGFSDWIQAYHNLMSKPKE